MYRYYIYSTSISVQSAYYAICQDIMSDLEHCDRHMGSLYSSDMPLLPA